MKLILTQEVDNLGLAGDVVDVADGYGRNYLLPRGMAMPATRGSLKQAEALTRSRKAHEAKTLGAAEAFRQVLEARALRIPVRVDERGHLYGSVTAAEVHRVLKERGHDVERRRIDLRRPLKELGEHAVAVKLHPQVTASVRVELVDVEGKFVPGAPAADEPTLEERALEAAEVVEQGEAGGETTPSEAAPTEQTTDRRTRAGRDREA